MKSVLFSLLVTFSGSFAPAHSANAEIPNANCLKTVGSSCAYGYNEKPSYYPFSMWHQGKMCPGMTVSVFNSNHGIACLPVKALGDNSFLAYRFANGSWANAGYFKLADWNSYRAMFACTASFPGCACVPVGSGHGVCTR